MPNLVDLINSLQAAISGLAQQVKDTQTALNQAVADGVKAATDPLNAQLTDLQTQLTAANALVADLQAKLAAAGSGGGFSQADIDAAVKAATDPLNAQIAAFPAQVSAAQAQAVSDLKTQLATAWANEQVSEAQFAALFAVAPPAPVTP